MNRNSKKRTEQNGCKVFPNRTSCRGCDYSYDPDRYDGGCLYGKDDILNEVRAKRYGCRKD